MAQCVFDINGNFYTMDKEKAIEVMNFGKEKMRCGIYGVYKEDYVKAINERYDNVEDLRKAVLDYQLKGFTVLFNE